MAWELEQDFVLSSIYVDEKLFQSENDWEVIDSLSDFVFLARDYGGLMPAELRRELLWNSQVTAYQTWVSGNGHLLSVANSRTIPTAEDPCALGLAAMGLTEFAGIRSRLILALEELNLTAQEIFDNYESIRKDQSRMEPFKQLDREFFDLNEEHLLARRAAWVRGLPNVHACSLDQAKIEVEKATRKAPLRRARLEVLRTQREEERREQAKQENTRFALDRNVREMGNNLLKKLARPLRFDPKLVDLCYQILPGTGISWPVADIRCNDSRLIIDLSNGTARLSRCKGPNLGPVQLPEEVIDHFDEEVDTAVAVTPDEL